LAVRRPKGESDRLLRVTLDGKSSADEFHAEPDIKSAPAAPNAVAARRTIVVIGAAVAEARALPRFFHCNSGKIHSTGSAETSQ